jgi:hypothetical protein
MWKKIVSIDDFKQMNKNTMLLKFTGTGEPDASLIGKDEHYKLYHVKDIKLPADVFMHVPGVAPTEWTPGMMIGSGVLQKDFETMVNEGLWWYRTIEIRIIEETK